MWIDMCIDVLKILFVVWIPIGFVVVALLATNDKVQDSDSKWYQALIFGIGGPLIWLICMAVVTCGMFTKFSTTYASREKCPRCQNLNKIRHIKVIQRGIGSVYENPRLSDVTLDTICQGRILEVIIREKPDVEV